MTQLLLRTGDGSLLVRFSEEINAENHSRVRRAFQVMEEWAHPAISNLHPAYASLLIEFDPLLLSFADLHREVEARLKDATVSLMAAKHVEVPVLYDGEDLAGVGALHGLTPEAVVALHCEPLYTVHFLGFQPGFPYLAGLPPCLETPRLATPRLKVPAGSVALAGKQTGIYPAASPGGWRLLGKTPLRLFHVTADPPTLFQIGDTVKFRQVSPTEFERLARGVVDD